MLLVRKKNLRLEDPFSLILLKYVFLLLVLLKVKVITILSNNQSGTQLVFYPLYLQQNKRYPYISFF